MPLTDVDVTELEQLPTSWPRDPLGNDFTWKATARAAGGGVIRMDGALRNYWIYGDHGSYDIELTAENAGTALRTLSGGHAGGDALFLRLQIGGSMLRPALRY